jgi:predicted amidohydrolase YtcJ
MMLTSGSDGPNLEPAAPLRDIGTAVIRKTELGVEMDSKEALSVMDAIKMFTINAAYLEFEEDHKGSIEQGKIADMVVLSEDPLSISHDILKKIEVDMTIIDGKIAYIRNSE